MVRLLVALWTAGLAVQAPDSATRARSATALHALHDSLSAVDAAAAQFQTDLVNASRDLVISRATRLTGRCAGARVAAISLDTLVAPRAPFRRDLATLRADLTRCEANFATDRWYAHADSVKAWAPYRLAKLGDALRRYRIAARAFMHQAHIN